MPTAGLRFLRKHILTRWPVYRRSDTSSCEGAYSVEACTVTALDAITAFAIPTPGSSSQSQPVFSGLVALQLGLLSASLSLLRTDISITWIWRRCASLRLGEGLSRPLALLACFSLKKSNRFTNWIGESR